MMVSSGHPSGPVASRLPQKRDSRIPGPGIQKAASQQQHPSPFSGLNGRRGRTPSTGPAPSSSAGNSSSSHQQSKSCSSDILSRRSSSPASNSSSLSLSRNTGSTSLIPGAPEIATNRRINTSCDKQGQSNYARPSIRPMRPTSIPSAPNQPSTVATNGSTIPPGHFSPAKISQPVITSRSDSSQKPVKVSSTSNGGFGNGNSSLVSKGKSHEFNVMRKSECQATGRKTGNHHQSSSPQQSNPSPSSSSTSSPPSSLPSTSPSTTSSSPHSVNGTSCIGTNHMSNKENSSFNSSGPPSNECHMKGSKSNNPTSCQSNASTGNGPVLSLLNSGGSSLPSSPAKMRLPSGNSLSRATSPGHLISHNYHNRTNEDFLLSVYSDSECSSRKSKVNILYSYSPSGRCNNFPAISEIAGVIETSTSLSNNNSNLIENNSLLAKCCNKAMSQLESTSNFSPRKDQLSSNVNPNLDRERVILNNSLRSSPIGEAENSPSNNISKFPSLRNLSSGQQSATNGSILTAIPSTAYIASQQFRRLSKNSDLRGSAASLLSASSNFSSAEEKQVIEIKKLRNELLKANEKIATLSTQLLTSTQMVTAFEQSLASTITRFQQLSVSSENKDREISRLKSTIDSLRKQCDSLLKEGTTSEQRNLDGINGEASDRESIKGSGAEGQHKMKKLKVRSVSKDRESDGSGPGWLRGSITRAFRKGRPRTRSGNDSGSDADSCSSRTNLNVLDQGFRSMPGTPVHSARVNVSNQIDEELTGLEVLELKNKLQEKDRVLTDIRLEALSVAHQMDGLKDSNNRMRGEIETLRIENRRLQRMVQRQSITSSVGSLASCADSALTFASMEGKENNLDKSPSEKRIKNFSSDSDLDPLLNALMKLKDATGNN